MIEFTLNGKRVTVAAHFGNVSLLEYLRQQLHLTGAKNGCTIGACGSCTVIVNEKGVRSCIVPLSSLAGKNVLTIEGLTGERGELHPIQQAFLDCGAIQCGFCTPGMVLSAYALLLKNPSPTEEEIKKGMVGNLCRCTGYRQIIEAIQVAAKRMKKS